MIATKSLTEMTTDELKTRMSVYFDLAYDTPGADRQRRDERFRLLAEIETELATRAK